MPLLCQWNPWLCLLLECFSRRKIRTSGDDGKDNNPWDMEDVYTQFERMELWEGQSHVQFGTDVSTGHRGGGESSAR